MKTKLSLVFSIFLTFVITSAFVNAYAGNLYLAEDEDVSSVSDADLIVSFSNGDVLNTQTNSEGRYVIDEENIFCWNNCNLVPPIKGVSMIIKNDDSTSIEYSTSNHGKSSDYYESIFVVPSFLKYNVSVEENDQVIPNKFDLNQEFYFVSFSGFLILKDLPENFALGLNAYSITLQIGDYSEEFLSNNLSNQDFLFNLEDDLDYTNLPININYVYIVDGNTPNLKLYDLNNREVEVLSRENIVFEGGFITKIEPSNKENFARAESLSPIPEPPLPAYSMSSQCQRFSGNPSSSYYPLLLIHGLHGDQDDYWAYIPGKFQDKGFKVYQVIYSPANNDNRYNAYLVYLCINGVKADVPTSKVNLVAHSMGGLASLTYIEGLGRRPPSGGTLSYSGDVNSLVTISSPLYGSYASNRLHNPQTLADFALVGSSEVKEALGSYIGETYNEPAYIDISVGSALTWNLNQGNKPPISYLSVAGINDNIAPIDLFHYEADDSDSVVSASSASLLTFNTSLVLLYLNHANEHGWSAWSVGPIKNWCNGLLQLCDIDPLVNGISSFLKGNNEATVKYAFDLASNEYYISSNSQVSDSIPSNFQEGMLLIRFIGEDVCSSCAKLRKNSINYPLNKNIDTGIFTYWSGNSNQEGTTLPSGYYDIYVNNQDTGQDIEIKSLQTTVKEINLSPPVTCSSNSQCGTNGYVGSNYCGTNENVYRNYVTYLCYFPGTPSSYCSNQTTAQLIQTCSYGCTAGVCNSQPTLSINVTSPLNNAVLNSRDVLFNIKLNKQASLLEFRDNLEDWEELCDDCSSYYDDERFSDGEHEVLVRANASPYVFESINFTVDSKDPRISKTEPRRGFTNGSFYVRYTEDNCAILELMTRYLNDGNGIGGSCDSGRNVEENVFIDVSDFEGKEIDAYFTVEDIAGNEDESRHVELTVDTIAPVLNNPKSFWYQGAGRYQRYIYFNFNVTEKNFDEIVYTYFDSRGRERERRICSRLRDGICEVRKSFSDGDYTLPIIIRDEAGNSVREEIGFGVD